MTKILLKIENSGQITKPNYKRGVNEFFSMKNVLRVKKLLLGNRAYLLISYESLFECWRPLASTSIGRKWIHQFFKAFSTHIKKIIFLKTRYFLQRIFQGAFDYLVYFPCNKNAWEPQSWPPPFWPNVSKEIVLSFSI